MSEATQNTQDRPDQAIPESTNGVVTLPQRTKPLREVKSIGEALRHPEIVERFKQAVPKHLSPERMLRVCALAIQKTPKLADADLMSLLGAMLALGSLGLEPNTPIGLAYLIPFDRRGQVNGQWKKVGTDVQVIIGYRGYIDLARRAGSLVSLHADVVYDGDDFSFEYGSNAHLRHVPKGARESGRPALWAYAHARLTDGEAFEVLPFAEIIKTRDASQGYATALRYKSDNPKGFASNPWVAFLHEMAAKTMVRRIAKMLPMSIELANAAALDAMSETGRVNLKALATAPTSDLGDMALLGHEEYIPAFDIGGSNLDRDEEPVEAKRQQQEEPKKAAAATVKPDQGAKQEETKPGVKRLDPAKYPPGETLEQARLRVAADQDRYGVAEGERDERPWRDALARERSAASLKAEPTRATFDAYLLDADGETVLDDNEEPLYFADPVAYVSALSNYMLTAERADAVLRANREYIEAAEQASEDARGLIARMRESLNGADQSKAGEGDGAAAPAATTAPVSLVVPLERAANGAPKLSALIAAVKDALAATPDDQLDAWVEQNEAAWTKEKLPPSTIRTMRKHVAERRGGGDEAPQQETAKQDDKPAEQPPATAGADVAGKQWADATYLLDEIAKVKDQGGFVELQSSRALKAIYNRLKEAGRTDLTKRVDDAMTAKAKEVGAPGAG
jgi:recombination protein RecT